MTLQVVTLDRIPDQPWRNGGGRTRELLAWPAGGDWRVRVSVADIERDGPFSPFPGVWRGFQVLSGAGVVLHPPGRPAVTLTPDRPPHAFDGALAPDCRLLDGPTRDLNLMVAGGPGRLWPAEQPWGAAPGWRGLFTLQPTTLRAGGERHELPAGSLAWSTDSPGPWQIDPPGRAWWLHAETLT